MYFFKFLSYFYFYFLFFIKTKFYNIIKQKSKKTKIYRAFNFFTIFCSVFAVFCVSSSLIAQNSDFTASRPNIIFILADDLGAHDLGYTGSLLHETPNLDKLAEKGVVFTSGYAACAVCSPTRAAIQTGKSPARLGITDWIRARFQGGTPPVMEDGKWPYVQEIKNGLFTPKNPIQLECEEKTIAEYLKECGYATCFIGKWHLGTNDFFPDKQGYDENFGGCDLGQPPSYFDPYYPGSTEKKAGDPTKNPQYRIQNLPPRRQGEFLTDREADEAVKFIRRNLDAKKPFFIQLSHYAVHSPTMGKSDIIKKYEEKKRLMAKTDDKLLTPFHGDQGEPDAATQKSPRHRNPAYAALVESVDDALGTILSAVEEMGISENTIIIFTSDNGGFCGQTDNFPLRSGKGTPYEGGIRVPWIIYVPSAVEPKMNNAPKICNIPITSVDILPTLLDFAGSPLTAEKQDSAELEGISIRPLITGEIQNFTRDTLFWHFPHYRRGYNPYSIIRNENWKLIRFYTNNGVKLELYDLSEDPRELKNVAQENAQIVQQLTEKLDEWLKKTGARIPRSTKEE
ncbi:MAG: sulfatase [Planctomycetia bacterium]|nr:sulfatase [Planctomycetia bacterium]